MVDASLTTDKSEYLATVVGTPFSLNYEITVVAAGSFDLERLHHRNSQPALRRGIAFRISYGLFTEDGA